MKLGFYTIALAHPVVPIGTARVRIIITVTHSDEQIDGLVSAFKKLADASNFIEDVKNNTTLFQEAGLRESALVSFGAKL